MTDYPICEISMSNILDFQLCKIVKYCQQSKMAKYASLSKMLAPISSYCTFFAVKYIYEQLVNSFLYVCYFAAHCKYHVMDFIQMSKPCVINNTSSYHLIKTSLSLSLPTIRLSNTVCSIVEQSLFLLFWIWADNRKLQRKLVLITCLFSGYKTMSFFCAQVRSMSVT